MNTSNETEKYVIIDTDCGIDDSLAIMLAVNCHQNKLINLLAITCCFGNTSVDNVVKNVWHTLKATDFEVNLHIIQTKRSFNYNNMYF